MFQGKRFSLVGARNATPLRAVCGIKMPLLCCTTYRLDALEDRSSTMCRIEKCMAASIGHCHVHFLLMGGACPQSFGGVSIYDGEMLLGSGFSGRLIAG